MGASNQGQARTQACLPGSQKPVHRELTPQAQPGLATLPHSLLRMVVQLGRKPSGPDSRLPQRRSRRGPISQLLSLLKIFTSKYVPVCHASAPSQPGRLSSPPARHGAASAAAVPQSPERTRIQGWLAATHPASHSAPGPLHLLLALLQAASHRVCVVHKGHMGLQAHVTSPRNLSCITPCRISQVIARVIFSAAVLPPASSSIDCFSPVSLVVTSDPWGKGYALSGFRFPASRT